MSLLGSAARFLGDVVKGAVTTDNVRDYQHASRTFKSGNYGLLPKTKRWWHIVFDVSSFAINNVNAARVDMGGQYGTDGTNSKRFGSENWTDTGRVSVLAKTVKLPSYKFETKRYNQYNRQTIGINKISYDPIQLSFHDDSLNVMRNFWDAYYTYYIQDARYRRVNKISNQGVPVPTEWIPRLDGVDSMYTNEYAQHWGLDTVNSNTQSLDRIYPFFDSIKIYHFSRPVNAKGTDEDAFPHYAEYTLVNPIISSFDHESLEYSSSEHAANSMTVEYETVLYAQGPLDSASTEVASWAGVTNTYYDKTKRPLGSPHASVLGQGGLLDTVTSLGTGNVLQKVLTVGKTVATWKSSGGVTGLVNSLAQEGKGILNTAMTATQRNIQNGSRDIVVPHAGADLSNRISNTLTPPGK